MYVRWISVPLAVLVTVAAAAQEPPAKAPLELAKQSGCLECHGVDAMVIGPAYRDVAERYKDDATARERLIETVKKGGKGNWARISRGVPMPPHSPRLTDEEISVLVNWILGFGLGKPQVHP
jgi:cytochrome c